MRATACGSSPNSIRSIRNSTPSRSTSSISGATCSSRTSTRSTSTGSTRRCSFRNISEIKEIEADISYLTPAQLQILSFWSSLGEEADLSEEKRRFLAIWKTLGPVYRNFRRRLASLGIAYNGMVQRAAADRIAEGAFAFPEPRRYVVAGFNALSECEKAALPIPC